MSWTTSHIASIAFVALAIVGCGPEPPGDSETSATSEATSTSTTGVGATGPSSTGTDSRGSSGSDSELDSTTNDTTDTTAGSDLICPGINDCTVLPDCETHRCGHVNSFLDDMGCPRQSCEEEACPEGFRCHSPWEDCLRCMSDIYECNASTSVEGVICICGMTENCDARWCVPDTIPVGDCQGD